MPLPHSITQQDDLRFVPSNLAIGRLERSAQEGLQTENRKEIVGNRDACMPLRITFLGEFIVTGIVERRVGRSVRKSLGCDRAGRESETLELFHPIDPPYPHLCWRSK